jgi:tripartite-type tricarboxylate transporter receptor subunit TctC
LKLPVVSGVGLCALVSLALSALIEPRDDRALERFAGLRSNRVRHRGIAGEKSIMTRHLRWLSAAMILVTGPGAAWGQSWPSRTIRAIVPLSAGSATDVVARTVLDQVSTQIGQSIIIENRTGAGNTIAMNLVAKSDPDGYTILVNSSAHTMKQKSIYPMLAFDTAKDFAAVLPLGNVPTALVVRTDRGYKTIHDLVAAAKANPGKMNYSSTGAGNSSHVNAERFRRSAGFEAVHVPFKGAPEATTEVLAGRADFLFTPLPVTMPFIKDGKLTALAVSGQRRATAMPEIPTTEELGYKNSYYNFWIGVFVPAKTPKDVVDRLYTETRKALALPAVREKLAKFGVDPMELTTEQFSKLVAEEMVGNAALAIGAGIKIE